MHTGVQGNIKNDDKSLRNHPVKNTVEDDDTQSQQEYDRQRLMLCQPGSHQFVVDMILVGTEKMQAMPREMPRYSLYDTIR